MLFSSISVLNNLQAQFFPFSWTFIFFVFCHNHQEWVKWKWSSGSYWAFMSVCNECHVDSHSRGLWKTQRWVQGSQKNRQLLTFLREPAIWHKGRVLFGNQKEKTDIPVRKRINYIWDHFGHLSQSLSLEWYLGCNSHPQGLSQWAS